MNSSSPCCLRSSCLASTGNAPDKLWTQPCYRGKSCPPYDSPAEETTGTPIYAEHDDAYLSECRENLLRKGIIL